MSGTSDLPFKLLLIGDSSVGKTSLLVRFCENTFSDSNVNMTSVDFKTRSVVVEGRTIQLQVWDTAGQERFRTITSSFYRGAHGIIVVYDVTEKLSFENVKLWMQEIQRYASAGVSRMLVGNKSDLEDRRCTATSTAKEFADSFAIDYVETSAKTGQDVDKAFHTLATAIVRQQAGGWGVPQASGVIRTDYRTPPTKKKC